MDSSVLGVTTYGSIRPSFYWAKDVWSAWKVREKVGRYWQIVGVTANDSHDNLDRKERREER